MNELEKAGAPGITIVEVHPAGYGYDPHYFGFQSEDVFHRYSHLSTVKAEVVCSDQDLPRFFAVRTCEYMIEKFRAGED